MRWDIYDQEDRLRIVTQNNLDCLFSVKDEKNPEVGRLKLLSVCKVDNLHTDYFKADSPHYFH